MVVLVVYGRTCTFGFLVWDDPKHVVDNELVNPPSAESLAKIWQEPYWGLYVPISYTVFAAEATVARRTVPGEIETRPNPAVFHAVSLLLHAACVLLVFVLLRRLCGHDAAAFAGALLFGLHPMQVESVAWISETRGLLCAFFSLLAILGFLRFVGYDAQGEQEKEHAKTSAISWLGYGLATAAFVAACLCKPAAVAVPAVVGVLAVGWLRHRPLKVFWLLTPWLLVALCVVVLTKTQQPDSVVWAVAPYWARPVLAADALAFYAYKLATPILLVPDYGRSPSAVMGHWTFYATWALPVVLLGSFCVFRSRRVWLVAAGVAVCWLLPVLGLVPFDYQRYSTVADRYVYLAMLGPAFALAWYLSKPRPRAILTTTVILFCVLAGLTVNQISHWRDDISLLDHNLAVNRGSVMGNHNRGYLYSREKQYRAAAQHFSRALATDPKHGESHLNMGWALASMGYVEDAKGHLSEALRLMPDEPLVHFNIAGVALFCDDDPQLAAKYFKNAVALDPGFVRAHLNLAQARLRQGRVDDAVASWQSALQLVHPKSKAAEDIRRAMKEAREGTE